MKQLFFFVFILLLVNSSCRMVDGKRVRGDGNITKENRRIQPFTELEVSGAIEVRLSQDSATSLVIETDDNLRPFISISQQGDKLKIGSRSGYSLRPSHKIIVYISTNEFRKISIAGASSVTGKNKIGNGQPLYFDLSGASELDMDVRAEKIELEAVGASKIDMRGEVKDLKIEASGASQITCFNLLAENTDIRISGAGEAEVFASVKLNARADGASSIRYKGDAEVTREVNGASSIKKE
ncbi:MAG: DUF2807 domain-containing protein [Chitinophagaceae bacterium]|nr:DUF2807 domain-containing protein [Chitinophagaceae bacterium]